MHESIRNARREPRRLRRSGLPGAQSRRAIFFSMVLAITPPGWASAPARAGVEIEHASPRRTPCFPGATPRQDEPAVTALRLNGVPVLVRSPAVVTRAPILLWHGFGPPNSEGALMQALPLDDVPAEKIYVGLPLFGERSPPGGLQEIARRQSADYLLNLLVPVADGVSADLRALDVELRRRGCVRPRESMDLFGYSAGGFAVLYALRDAGVSVDRVVLLNVPTSAAVSTAVFEHATQGAYGWSEASRQLARRFEPFDIASHGSRAPAKRPGVLLLQGAEDDAALRAGAEDLERQWRPAYHAAGADSRLQLRQLVGVGHGWLNEGTPRAVGHAAAEWFNGPRAAR